MFGLRPRAADTRVAELKEAHEQHIADLKEAHEKHIADLKEAHEQRVAEVRAAAQPLAEQIDYLRMQLGPSAASLAMRPTPTLDPDGTAPAEFNFGVSPFMGEEEEELRALAKDGFLSPQELETALAGIGAGSDSRIDIE